MSTQYPIKLSFHSPIVAAHIRWGFFLSTASSFWPGLNKFSGGVDGSGMKTCWGALTAPCNIFERNNGKQDAFERKPTKTHEYWYSYFKIFDHADNSGWRNWGTGGGKNGTSTPARKISSEKIRERPNTQPVSDLEF